MPIKHQPLFGANMPNNRKGLGNLDKSPIELQRNVSKLMKGTTTAGAGETSQEDALVNKQDKNQAPAMAKIFSKGLRAEDTPMTKQQRVDKGASIMAGRVDEATVEGKQPSPTYQDFQKVGGSNATVIVKKKATQQF